MHTELLPERHEWWRIASSSWSDALDPSYAQRRGGRWNPPQSFPTLYLNEELATARFNLRLFIARWPYEPEDLRDDTGPVLLGARLPRNQSVADAHSRSGIAAWKLPPSCPLDASGKLVPHALCQRLGAQAKERGLRGVRWRVGRKVSMAPAVSSRGSRRLHGVGRGERTH